MRFGVVHRIMTDALAALGILALANTTTMPPWTTGTLLVTLSLALVVPERWQHRPIARHFTTAASLTLLLLQVVRLATGHSAVDVAIEFAAFLQIIRIATRRGAAHDQQIISLALLHFVAGGVLGGGLAYGLCFFGFLVVAPGALVLSHLRREVEGNYRQGARDRTGLPVDVPRILRSRRVVGRGFLITTCLLSIPIFLFTATLFLLFPRVGLSLLLINHQQKGRMVGFSDKVDLGEVGVLRTDPSIALRFEATGLPDPPPDRLTLRLRGTAFDRYDGRRWERTTRDPRPARERNESLILARQPYTTDRKITFDLEPIDPPVVFLPQRTVALRTRPQQAVSGEPLALLRGAEADVRYQGAEGRGLRYEAYVAPEGEALNDVLAPQDRTRYLELPATLSDRLRALAHEWTDAQPSPYLKARALEEHLKHEYTYDTASPSGGKSQPVDHFLFESKRGHCEFFSTAMALMLREVGIPSRNVTGFVGGTYNRFGHYYAVREGDAHSWVEAYLDDPVRAWITFDPTPTSGAQPLEEIGGTYVYMRDFFEALSQRWNHYVVGYDIKVQARLFDDVGRKYDRLRREYGPSGAITETLTRGPIAATAIVALTAIVFIVAKRRKRPHATPETKPNERANDPGQLKATALYRALEEAMLQHGIPRPVGVPPLRHAEHLAAREHPLAPSIVALTKRYLATRFGGDSLTDDGATDFEHRVREIREQPQTPHPKAT